MKSRLILLLFLMPPLFGYDFNGNHFVCQYKKCDSERLNNVMHVLASMFVAIDASGATVLSHSFYKFEPGGLTAIFMLSESHASIHIYPEHGSCFVDLFTCGNNCKWEPFHEIMRAYLEPEVCCYKVLKRD